MARFDLTYWENIPNNYAIPQGSYYSFVIYYPELDLTEWQLKGQIRKTYDAPEVLAEFNFLPVVYGQISNKTGNYSSITVYLNASQTAGIQPTKVRTSKADNREGSNVYVYDIEAIDPTNTENVFKLITKSWVEVEGEVTRW